MSVGLRRCFQEPKGFKMETESNDWGVSNITCFYLYEVIMPILKEAGGGCCAASVALFISIDPTT